MNVATDRDIRIQARVREELELSPEVDAAGIGVAVDAGTVALSGEVDDPAQRVAAKRAALRVREVRAVIDDMTVHPRSSRPITETDIAKEVERALRAAAAVPDSVKAEVEGHRVTLRGDVETAYQRDAAEETVQCLRGVMEVENFVAVNPDPSSPD